MNEFQQDLSSAHGASVCSTFLHFNASFAETAEALTELMQEDNCSLLSGTGQVGLSLTRQNKMEWASSFEAMGICNLTDVRILSPLCACYFFFSLTSHLTKLW